MRAGAALSLPHPQPEPPAASGPRRQALLWGSPARAGLPSAEAGVVVAHAAAAPARHPPVRAGIGLDVIGISGGERTNRTNGVSVARERDCSGEKSSATSPLCTFTRPYPLKHSETHAREYTWGASQSHAARENIPEAIPTTAVERGSLDRRIFLSHG
eukprot:9466330-Pyramimonas_sp.AAC.2